MKKVSYAIFLTIFYFTGCATQNKHLLKVDTTPPGAIVSVHETDDVSSDISRQIAGISPFEKNFEFGKTGKLWIEIEKRGYAPHIEKVLPETGNVFIDLNRVKDKNGQYIRAYSLPEINRLLIAGPDIKVINRGFSSEEISVEQSKMAGEELIKGIDHLFSGKYEVVSVEASDTDKQLLRPLWRDIRSAIALLDPIRLKYFSEPPYLETKSSRNAARKMGEKYGAQVMLFVSGKQNLETAGMVAGKIGITAAGTATSYAGGYSRALSRGDSFFVYNVYTPSFAEGTLLKAALINCSNGEILWVNKGLWGPISFDDPETLENVVFDLFGGITQE